MGCDSRATLDVHVGRPARAVDWDEIDTIVEDAYRTVAPKTLVARLDADVAD